MSRKLGAQRAKGANRLGFAGFLARPKSLISARLDSSLSLSLSLGQSHGRLPRCGGRMTRAGVRGGRQTLINRLAGGAMVASLAIFGLVSAISATPTALAEDITAQITDSGDSYISLSLRQSANCPNTNNIHLVVAPDSLQHGSITSDCATVQLNTSGVYDYSLAITGSGDQKLHRTSGNPHTLDPNLAAIPSAPAELTADSWGFAVAGLFGFDQSYTKETSNNLDTSSSNWAAVPANSFFIKNTDPAGVWTDTEEYDVYFAAAADVSTPKGEYTGSVVFTASSEGRQLPSDNSSIVVDYDPAMIPVVYTGTDTNPEWKVADTNTKWYNYSKKQWANAVTVTSSARSSSKYATPGTIIDENDVLSYYVYIPRYRYKIWTTTWRADNFPKAIEIEFEDCHSNGISCASGYTKATVADLDLATNVSNALGKWLTHPAFTFGGKELNGFWVGKYESSNSATVPRSMPDVAQVTIQTIKAMFEGAQDVARVNGTGEQGIDKAQSDVRIFNNDDWGAVAYLSQSLYGVCTNVNCTENGQPATAMSSEAENGNGIEHQKIWNNSVSNNCNGYAGYGKTGYGSNGRSDTCIPNIYNTNNLWYTANGKLASSTHNQSGIYDLAGGVWEYTLDVYADDNPSGTPAWRDSGFTAETFDLKYMNKYFRNQSLGNDVDGIWSGNYNLSPTFTTALGQSLYETGGDSSLTTLGMWNGDFAQPVYPGLPWSVRGGGSFYEASSGVFTANSSSGGGQIHIGSRLLISRPGN